jgi:hypothetical protein
MEPEQFDFVYIASDQRPYRVKTWGPTPWMFYWHPDKKWVSHKELTFEQARLCEEYKLPKNQAKLYGV